MVCHELFRYQNLVELYHLFQIFAGLSALGALISGSSNVANTIISTNNAKLKLEEKKRHNEKMEAIALDKPTKTKTGGGLYLKPHKGGLGLFVRPYSKDNHHMEDDSKN